MAVPKWLPLSWQKMPLPNYSHDFQGAEPKNNFVVKGPHLNCARDFNTVRVS